MASFHIGPQAADAPEWRDVVRKLERTASEKRSTLEGSKDLTQEEADALETLLKYLSTLCVSSSGVWNTGLTVSELQSKKKGDAGTSGDVSAAETCNNLRHPASDAGSGDMPLGPVTQTIPPSTRDGRSLNLAPHLASAAATRTKGVEEGNDEPWSDDTLTEWEDTAFMISQKWGDVRLLELLEQQSSAFKKRLGRSRVFVTSAQLAAGSAIAHQTEDILLGWRADQLQFSVSALHWATCSNRPKLAEFLITECHNDIDEEVGATLVGLPGCCTETEPGEETDKSPEQTLRRPCCICGDWTPLMLAAALDRVAVVSTLLSLGAQVHARDASGYTAVGHAAFNGSVGSLLLLVRGGAALQNVDGRGSTLMDVAYVIGSADLYHLNTYFCASPEASLTASGTPPPDPGVAFAQETSPSSKWLHGFFRQCTTKCFLTCTALGAGLRRYCARRKKEKKPSILPASDGADASEGLLQTLITGACPQDWEIIGLPSIALFNLTVITAAALYEVPRLSISQWMNPINRTVTSNVMKVFLTMLWALFLSLFRIPDTSTMKQDAKEQRLLPSTGVQDAVKALQDRLASDAVREILGIRERPWRSLFEPGSNPTVEQLREKRKEYLREWYRVFQSVDTSRLCYTCFAIQPYRTFHCRYCKRCIPGFDHHCFWLGQCIHADNHRLFFIFVTLATIVEDIHLGILIVNSVLGITNLWNHWTPGFVRHLSVSSVWHVTPLLSCLSLGIHVLAIVWMHKLLWTQFYGVIRNLTTYEQLRGSRYAHFWHKKPVLVVEQTETSTKTPEPQKTSTIRYISAWRNPFDEGWYKNCRVFWAPGRRPETIDFLALKEKSREQLNKEISKH